jgi:hypothetical protein
VALGQVDFGITETRITGVHSIYSSCPSDVFLITLNEC